MIYLLYGKTTNKYYGTYNDVDLMVQNKTFIEKMFDTDIILYGLNSNSFKMTLVNLENIKKEYDLLKHKVKENRNINIYLLYNQHNNQFITYHTNINYMKEMVKFFEKDYIIKKTTLNSIYLDIEDSNINVTIEKPKIEEKVKVERTEEEAKEIYEINRELNILKQHQKRLQEKQTEYEANKDLYLRFKKEMKEREAFIVPELFLEKFKLFEKLEKDNMLTFENYIKNEGNNFIENSYELLFEGGSNINL